MNIPFEQRLSDVKADNFGESRAPSSAKLFLSELLYDIRRSTLDRPSAWFWWRRLWRLRFEIEKKELTNDGKELLEAFALAFCLTRADERTVITDRNAAVFLEKIGWLGLSISSTSGLHGAALKRASNYNSAATYVFQRMAEQVAEQEELTACLHFLAHRYVGHRRRDIDRDGFVEGTNFTTVPTHRFASRRSGSIWTYSQQSCVVYVLMSPDRFALGHWTFSPASLERDVAALRGLVESCGWTHVRIFAQPGSSIEEIRAPSVETYENISGTICSIGVVRMQDGYRLVRESHAREEVELPLGPAAIVPKNQYVCVEQISLPGRAV